MTVDYADENVVICIWFNTRNELQEERFRPELLELVRE
ncbi:MAG: YodC family protein [Gammaproteobacteria bacterium]|nr:YodC family protein [Gammaproteobacteria bacterium]